MARHRSLSNDIGIAVVESIAEHEGVDPLDLDFTLEEYIATDALEALAAKPHSEWSLRFTVDGHAVEIDSEAGIVVDGTRFD